MNVRVFRLGDRSVLVRGLGDWDPAALAEAVAETGWPDLDEAVAAYESVALYFRTSGPDLGEVLERLAGLEPRAAVPGRLWEIPVCYQLGPDLEEVAARLGLPSGEVVRLHSDREYRCHAVGFSPGFPYLGYLPEQLSGLPRLGSPRPRVPAGSVGITGRQTCVYPSETPGGWWLIGRTPLTVASLSQERFPIRAGDRVRFRAIGPEEYDRMVGSPLWEEST
jgi:inhibitor of KinA